jgi:hypothetical protein
VSWLESGRARRVSVAILAALAISFVATLASGEGADTGAGRLGGDYPAFYAAATIAGDGDLDEVNDLRRLEQEQADLFPADEDEGFLTWAYPPHVALLYRPLAALPYRPSYALHTGLMVAAFVAAVLLLRPLVPWVARAPLPAVALGMAAWPMFRGIGAGQNTALTLLLLVAAWRATASGKDWHAGVLLGLLLFKPQFALLAVALWAVTRRWRTVVAFGGVAAATWALTAAFAGADWVSRWLDDVRAYDATEDVNAHNHVSLPEAAHAAFELSAVGWVAAVGVGGWTAWRWFRAREVDLALAVPAILLCAAHAVFYDVGLTVLTAAVLLPTAPVATVALYAAAFAEPLKEPLGWNPLVLVLVGCGSRRCRRDAQHRARRVAPHRRRREPVAFQGLGHQLGDVAPALPRAFVDEEQPATRLQRAPQRGALRLGRRRPEDVHVDGEGGVERLVDPQVGQHRLLDGEPAVGHVVGVALPRPRHGRRRTVDGQHPAVDQAVADEPGRDAGPAAELQDAFARAGVEQLDGPGDPRRDAQSRAPPLASSTDCLPAEIHGIMPRSSLPTASIWWDLPASRRRWKFARPPRDSAIHSSANLPVWISSRIFFISAFVSAVMMRGPRVTSPYSAVSLIEYRMPPMPCSYMRSTMSFSSCRHSKYADSGWYPASTKVSNPAWTSAVTPPQSTTCSPKRSVSVSSSKVVSSTPARVPPMASA